jgi:hypothetical protein
VRLHHLSLDLAGDLLGLVGAPVGQEPARALGDGVPDEDDPEREDRPEAEADRPADVVAERVQEQDGQPRGGEMAEEQDPGVSLLMVLPVPPVTPRRPRAAFALRSRLLVSKSMEKQRRRAGRVTEGPWKFRYTPPARGAP